MCTKTFISRRHLRVHFRIHSNERPYKCEVCEKAFIQYSSLKSHMKLHGKMYVCNICKMHFQELNDFQCHDCPNNENNTDEGSIIRDDQHSSL